LRLQKINRKDDTVRKISLLNDAIAIDETAFNAYNALGYAYLEKGDSQAAIDAFLNSIRVHPEDKESYFDIARLHAQQKRFDQAKRYLNTAIEKDSSSRADISKDPLLSKIPL
jgi:tetratricopeptide (TPR) repeat protein